MDGFTGFTLPPGDYEKLGDLIELLLDDPARHARMSKAARRLALDRFSLEQQIHRLTEVCRAVFGVPEL